MIKFFRRLWLDKRGNALVIAGAALPLIIGSAGLASDTIQWVLWKRQLQRAADSAAIAGVYAKMQTQTVTTAINTDVDKVDSFRRPGAATTHPGYVLQSEPVITYPTITNTTNAVNVTLAVQKPLGFSGVFLSSAPTITASATAATVQTGVYCVVSLENTGATGITATGNSDINLGCGMITNSTSLNAAIATGSSSVTASPVAAVGDIQDSSHWNGAELLPFTVAEKDPFAGVDPPVFTGCQGSSNRINVNNPHDVLDRSSDTGIQCVSDINVSGTLKLGSATYVIDSGNFSAGSQAHVSCTGCTIIFTNSTSGSTATIGGITNINGGAELKMTAPEGGTYDGILFYQDRRAAAGATNSVNGNSDSVLSGALYFPNQTLDINGTSNLTFTCAQFVSRTISFSGNGSINNTCTAGYGDDAITGNHVRLVA